MSTVRCFTPFSCFNAVCLVFALHCLVGCFSASEEVANNQANAKENAAINVDYCTQSNPRWRQDASNSSEALWIDNQGEFSILRARIKASELPKEAYFDEDSMHWSLVIKNPEKEMKISLSDPLQATIFSYQQSDDVNLIQFVYLQAKIPDTQTPSTAIVSYLPQKWSKELKAHPSTELDVPFAFLRTKEGPNFSECEADSATKSFGIGSKAFQFLRESCGIYLHPAVEKCVQHPEPSQIAFSAEFGHPEISKKIQSQTPFVPGENVSPSVYSQFSAGEKQYWIHDLFKIIGDFDGRLKLIAGPYFAKIL